MEAVNLTEFKISPQAAEKFPNLHTQPYNMGYRGISNNYHRIQMTQKTGSVLGLKTLVPLSQPR